MKVVTINTAGGKSQQKSYKTRSRGKSLVEEESSSNEDIREMVRVIEKGEKGANSQKAKMGSK